MKNTLADLNNYLFEQLERINDDDLEGEALDNELKKSHAIVGIAGKLIESGNLELRAMQYRSEYGKNTKLPTLLEDKDGKG